MDDLLDFSDFGQGKLLGGRKAVEELLRHHIDLLVRRLGAQNHCNEELKTAVII